PLDDGPAVALGAPGTSVCQRGGGGHGHGPVCRARRGGARRRDGREGRLVKRRPLISLLPMAWCASAVGVAKGGAPSTDAWPRISPGTRLVFPRDHGAHPDYRTEWWYITGALQVQGAGQAPRTLGFQITFF